MARFVSLLVGDPKAELCPDCTRALCEEVAAEISAELLEDLGRRNGEVAPPAAHPANFVWERRFNTGLLWGLVSAVIVTFLTAILGALLAELLEFSIFW